MMSGGCPIQLVCTMTCTSEMSGSASRGTCFSDQMPARVSRRTKVKTRKGLRAQRSMILESMSDPSFGVDAQLFAGDRLSVLADSDGDLPCSTGAEITLAFILAITFLREPGGHIHCCHAHGRHRRHEEGHSDVRSGDGGAIGAREFYVEGVWSFARRVEIGGEIDIHR